ncbi:MAG: malonic semialdehyde reductase [Ancalomicrobiaceae bacterium]|nr:malonic semialdehyde reductase [Ancalomicrobiaceae bacterium]
MTHTPVRFDDTALAQLFSGARTFNYFLDKPVATETLLEATRLAEFGPTEANTLPGRFLILTSSEAKAKIGPLMSGNNQAKTLAAPAVIVAAYDAEFYEHLPKTFPQVDARSWYVGRDEPGKKWVAERSAALQIGYLILALRSLGLDCGPMGGFDAKGVDEAFFAGTSWHSFIVINVGYGDRSKLHPRNPRLDTDEFVKVI